MWLDGVSWLRGCSIDFMTIYVHSTEHMQLHHARKHKHYQCSCRVMPTLRYVLLLVCTYCPSVSSLANITWSSICTCTELTCYTLCTQLYIYLISHRSDFITRQNSEQTVLWVMRNKFHLCVRDKAHCSHGTQYYHAHLHATVLCLGNLNCANRYVLIAVHV